MKNLIPITLIAFLLFASGCGLKEVVGPNAEGGTTNSDSYQPVTKGSTWKYSIQVAGQTALDQITMTMTGDVKTFNGRVYYKCLAVSSTETSEGFFGHSNGRYASLNEETDPKENIEETYLDDTLPVGGTYTAKGNYSGPIFGTDIQFVGTIVEKGATKTVNGKSFKNVIHTRVESQSTISSGQFVTDGVVEYFIAKGVGIIEVDVYFGTQVIARQTIVSYNIK
jgi:hypothetical protein